MNSNQTKASRFTFTARSLADIASHSEEMAHRAEGFALRCQTQQQRRYEEGRAAALYEVTRMLRSTVLLPPAPPSDDCRVYGTAAPAPAPAFSPAIGEFAVQQAQVLREEHRELYEALKKVIGAVEAHSSLMPAHLLDAKDVMRRVCVPLHRRGGEVLR